MDSEKYLIERGWIKGQGLRSDSIKRPLLVSHRRGNMGLGHNNEQNGNWWENLLDLQLKSLDPVNGKKLGDFVKNGEGFQKAQNPLYSRFIFGGILRGTVENSRVRDTSDGSVKRKKRRPLHSSSMAVIYSDQEKQIKRHKSSSGRLSG